MRGMSLELRRERIAAGGEIDRPSLSFVFARARFRRGDFILSLICIDKVGVVDDDDDDD